MAPSLLAIAPFFGVAAPSAPPPIRITYFVPSDRQPPGQRHDRRLLAPPPGHPVEPTP